MSQFNARVQHKIDTWENWSKAENFTPLKGEIIIYTTNESGISKIQIKIGDGNTNVNKLPFVSSSGGGGGGAGSPQVQVDYNQNDDTQVDYIKNRPFYTIPPEYDFTFDLPRTMEAITWDGIIKANHPCITIPGENMKYYKVSDRFMTSEDCINGYMIYTMDPEVLEDEFLSEESPMVDCKLCLPLLTEVVTNFTFLEDNEKFLNTFALSFNNVSGTISLEDLGLSLEVPEPGTYFLVDEQGDILTKGYVSSVEGPIVDVEHPDFANDTSILKAQNIYGEGSLLACKLVFNDFLELNKVYNSNIWMQMTSWNFDDLDSSMLMQCTLTPELFSDGIEVLLADDNESYVLLMEGTLPMLGSIKSSLATFNNGLQVPGPGTYLCYNDMNKLSGGMELWVRNFATPETVFQIDPKYIPKQKVFVPDYNEDDPESDSYIANKPYYNYSQYNYYDGNNINDTSLRVKELVTEEGFTIFYQWGYSLNDDFKNPAMYNKGYSDIQCSKGYVRALDDNTSLPVENLSTTTSSQEKVIIVYKYSSGYIPMAYIAMEDNVTDNVLVYGENWNTESITFPKRGIYYLCQVYDNTILYVYQLSDLKRYRNNLPSSNVTTTDSVTQGSSTPITSGGVYNALQNIKVTTDSEIIANSTNPVAGGAVYTALQNLNVKDADTIDGYHIRVSTEPPVEGEVDDYTITFVI